MADYDDEAAPVPASEVQASSSSGDQQRAEEEASRMERSEAESQGSPAGTRLMDAPPPPSMDYEDGDGGLPPMPNAPPDGPDAPRGGWTRASTGDVDEDAALVADFASHPMMDRVQKVLIATLARELERTAATAREKVYAAAQASRKREDVGVELYGTQQQLARLQLHLEKMHNDSNDLVEKRSREEVEASSAKAAHAALAKALGERRKHLTKNQTELDAINDTLRQVSKYNEEMRKEIAVTKRATYKAEENVSHLETAKRGQDVYIDSLEERVQRLSESIAVHESQLLRQQGESKEARGMLAETAQEMDLIAFEKKQLLQQWKAALVQLTRRDEALAAAASTLQQARTEIQDLQTEIEGTRRDAGNARGEAEALRAVRDRLARDEAALDDAAAKLRAECGAVAAQFQLLQRSMEHTEREEARVAAEGKKSGDSLAQLGQNIQTVTQERHRVETKIAAARSASTTVTKAVRNLRKAAQVAVKEGQDLEMDHAHLDNELARVRVDALNTDAHNSQLGSTLEVLLRKLRGQDELIAKYQTEIRQRNDDIEKKMYRVDRLNRKHEKMTERAEEGESVGPLEATIRNLSKEREALALEVTALQSSWLADQTSLVHATQATEQTLGRAAELKAQARILGEKRLQLLKSEEQHEAQAASVESHVKSMRADVTRLNELLGRHAALQADLQNESHVMEMAFQAELKELEAASLVAEKKVSLVRDAKAALLEEVVDTERAVMLWEKKIQIEKETQDALNPEAGTSEIKAMEVEIHRMRLRLDALQREQERMVGDMEKGLAKREAITLRFKGKERPSMVEGGGHTRASLKKQVAHLRGTIQQTARDAAQLSNAITARQRQLANSTAALADATARYGDLEAEAQALQARINALLYEKQRRTELQQLRDRTARRFLDVERGAAPALTERDAAATDARAAAAAEDLKQVRGAITQLRAQFDYLAEPLDRIMKLTDDAEAGCIQGDDGAQQDAGGHEEDDL